MGERVGEEGEEVGGALGLGRVRCGEGGKMLNSLSSASIVSNWYWFVLGF